MKSEIDIKKYNGDKVARGERLLLVRKMANKTRPEMEEYGLSAATLVNWENARAGGLTEKGAKRVVTIFKDLGVQFSMGWLLHGRGSPPALKLPDSEEKAGVMQLPEEIKDFCSKHPDAIYVKVNDEGMNPKYSMGDYVAGKRYYRDDIQGHATGKICIVETQMGKILLRLVQKGKQEGYYYLICTNPTADNLTSPYEETELASAAPVYLCISPNP